VRLALTSWNQFCPRMLSICPGADLSCIGAEIKWGIVSRDKLREVDLKDPADAKAMVGSFFLTVAPSWAANRLRSVTTLLLVIDVPGFSLT
jgi:hypothetical protein